LTHFTYYSILTKNTIKEFLLLDRDQISIYYILNDLDKKTIIDYIKKYSSITNLKKSLPKDELIDMFKENMSTIFRT
jgi:hypothetical protein